MGRLAGFAGYVAREGREIAAGRLRDALARVFPGNGAGIVLATAAGACLPAAADASAPGPPPDSPVAAGFAGEPVMDSLGRCLLFEGELYNSPELRREPGLSEAIPGMESDAGVFLAAYARRGEAALPGMNGQWAFALYDPGKRRLLCGRDHLGVKPFYHARSPDGGLFFASTPALLLTLSGEQAFFEPAELGRYLLARESDAGGATLYRGIRQVPAGASGVFAAADGTWRESAYWSVPAAGEGHYDDASALDEFQFLFEDAVKIRLRGAAPPALTLSGGVDSSALAVAASRCGAAPAAYTAHFPSFPDIDETACAGQVAAALRLEHLPVAPDPAEPWSGEGEWTVAQGLPFASLSGYLHWLLLREIARRGAGAVLNGQGGDELFRGYESCLPEHVFATPFSPLATLAKWRRATGRVRLPGYMFPVHYAARRLPGWVRRLRAAGLGRVFAAPLLAAGLAALESGRKGEGGGCRAGQWAELTRRPLPQILRQDDRNARAFGLVSRMPFLDPRLVEFALRLPMRQVFRDGWGKYLLRRYLDRHGFAAAAWRTHKLGFVAPQGVWEEALWARHQRRLLALPLAEKLLNPAVRKVGRPGRFGKSLWEAYNLLRLGELCGVDLFL